MSSALCERILLERERIEKYVLMRERNSKHRKHGKRLRKDDKMERMERNVEK
jgi:hypothetical protein